MRTGSRPGALVVAALAVLGLLGTPLRGVEAQRGGRIGQPAPELTGGPWINGEPQSLEKLRGRVVFVEFWTYG